MLYVVYGIFSLFLVSLICVCMGFRMRRHEKPLVESAHWSIWYGKEIEGTKDQGHYTLFIRGISSECSYNQLVELSNRFKRIWFCAEFRDWNAVRIAFQHFERVCVEVQYGKEVYIPADILRKARIYLKVPDTIGLKNGDQICFGAPYCDEAFEVGKGIRVKPEQYREDVKIA